MTKHAIQLLMLTTIVAAARTGRASNPEVVVAEDASVPMYEVSLKAGGHFPQLTNDLNTNFDALLKFGVGIALERRLQLFGEFGYTQPTHEAKVVNDPRLGAAGGPYKSEMTVRDLNTSLGLTYFFREMTAHWLPYAGAGVRFHFLKSEVTGDTAGTAFGKNDETSTQIGGQAFGGLGFRAGPGLLLGELRFSYAPVAQKVTGDANVGSTSLLLGYGLLF